MTPTAQIYIYLQLQLDRIKRLDHEPILHFSGRKRPTLSDYDRNKKNKD